MRHPNLKLIGEMFTDRRYREFTLKLDALFRSDPAYNARKLKQIFVSAARGERIVRFQGQYVISSFVPPVPSDAFLTFVRGGIDQNRLFQDLAQGRRKVPLSSHLCITRRCFYRCEHCGATVDPARDELNTAQWIQVLSQLQDLGVACIVFSGGEPLLRPDMEKIIASLDDRSSTLLFTNGRLLTRERAERLKMAGLFILAVSLDSPDAHEHNRMRGNPEAYDAALAAIRNASAAGLYTLVSSVVYRKHLNEAYLERLFQLAQAHGAHEVRIHQPIPRGELSDVPGAEEIFYGPEDFARLNRIQFAANRRHDFIKVSSFPYTEGRWKFGCGAGNLHSYITATGDLWPCDFMPLSFGNLLHEGVIGPVQRMIAVSGIPKTSCWARQIAPELRGKQLPLIGDEAAAVCGHQPRRIYPRFYKDLQEEKTPGARSRRDRGGKSSAARAGS